MNECDRKGCDNIECERHSDIYGYLCEDCLLDLANKGVDQHVWLFIGSDKNHQQEKEIAAADYFGKIFPIKEE